ncbi:MAG: 23S rRNA (uracil(1939)-C(5))-methyltransferase RlmD [Lachnospiraceae bacterium]
MSDKRKSYKKDYSTKYKATTDKPAKEVLAKSGVAKDGHRKGKSVRDGAGATKSRFAKEGASATKGKSVREGLDRNDGERRKFVRSKCVVSDRCGACKYIDVPYDEQIEQKKERLTTLLKPYCKLESMIRMEHPDYYRNKVHAVFSCDGKKNPIAGVYEEGTHYVVNVEHCFIENRIAGEIIQTIRGMIKSFKIKTYDEDSEYGLLRHVLVRTGHITGEVMVVLVLASPILPSKANFVKALRSKHPEITTIIVNVNNRRTSMVLGEKEQVVYGKGYIEDILCGMKFKISPKSFYQVNSVQTEVLYKKAISFANLSGTEIVLDAYCGIGTIGMVASSMAKKVIGVELNRDAVKDAIVNAKINQIKNIEFYQKDAGEFMVQLAECGEQVDVVFMDPPRSGSDEVFLDSLAILAPKKVVYISCHPETLVRDLEILVKKGYKVEKAIGVDMFPMTGHIETVCLLHRSNT